MCHLSAVGAEVCMLFRQDTREPMLRWLAAALETNAERSKTIVSEELAAPDGFFANLNSVLLALCQPFLEPSSDLAWRRIDVRCHCMPGRMVEALQLRCLRRLACLSNTAAVLHVDYVSPFPEDSLPRCHHMAAAWLSAAICLWQLGLLDHDAAS